MPFRTSSESTTRACFIFIFKIPLPFVRFFERSVLVRKNNKKQIQKRRRLEFIVSSLNSAGNLPTRYANPIRVSDFVRFIVTVVRTNALFHSVLVESRSSLTKRIVRDDCLSNCKRPAVSYRFTICPINARSQEEIA